MGVAASHRVGEADHQVGDGACGDMDEADNLEGAISAGKVFEILCELSNGQRTWTRKGLHTPGLPDDLLPDVLGVRAQRHADRWQVWYPGAKSDMGTHSHSRVFGSDEQAAIRACAEWAWAAHLAATGCDPPAWVSAGGPTEATLCHCSCQCVCVHRSASVLHTWHMPSCAGIFDVDPPPVQPHGPAAVPAHHAVRSAAVDSASAGPAAAEVRLRICPSLPVCVCVCVSVSASCR